MFVNIIREMVNFELGKVIEKVVFSRKTSLSISLAVESLWLRARALERGNPKVRGSIPHGDSEFFSLCHARDKTKKRRSLYHYYAPRQN